MVMKVFNCFGCGTRCEKIVNRDAINNFCKKECYRETIQRAKEAKYPITYTCPECGIKHDKYTAMKKRYKGLCSDACINASHSKRLLEKYKSGKLTHHQTGKPRTKAQKVSASKTIKGQYANGTRKPSVAAPVWYNGLRFDSKWEVELAKNLDKQGVTWEQGKCLFYFDRNEKQRLYFPDFYLPNYDLYLEVKNPYRLRVSEKEQDKHQYISENFPNVRYLLSKKICESIQLL